MLIELRSYLEAVQSEINDLNLCKEILKKLTELNVTEMSKDRVLIADLWYSVVKSIQEIDDDNKLENEVIESFNNISQIAKSGEDSSSLILINFLNDLYQHRNGMMSKINVSVQESTILLNDLEPIKFIFLICDEDENRYFPANRLLSNIVLDSHFISSKIEPYHINLLQLAVEMYRITGDADPQKQFEHLIKECNLHFINYLDGTSTRVDTIDMANYRYNNVMVFYNEKEKKVLIRHENEQYFSNLPAGVHINHEINGQKMPIGYSVELSVEGEAIDYSKAIKESPVELLKLFYVNGCKNVLIQKMIIKMSDGTYKPLNPFCINDKWIVKGHINRREAKVCQTDQIIECIDEGRLQMLSSYAKCDGINQVTFGLCLYLLEKEVVDIEKMFRIEDDLECRQTSIIKNWVTLTVDKIDSIEYILRKWIDDLDYCKEDLLKNFVFEKKRIRDILPFALSMKWVYELLNMPDEPSVFVGTISYESDEKYYIDFSPRLNKSLAKNQHDEILGIFSSDVILSEETDSEEIFQEHMQGYFILKDGKWYFDISIQNLLKIIVNIELFNEYLIQEKILSIFTDDKCRLFFPIMELQKDELLDVDIKKVDKLSMFRYRLLHNILYNKINEDLVDDYLDIFSKHQILSFEEINNDELFANDDDNTLIVPKDRIELDAVLNKVYNKYIRKHSTRDELWWYLSQRLSCKDNIYYKNGNKISNIRFLFDNIEHGTATIRTLAVNLGKEDEWIKFELQRTKMKEDDLKNKIENQQKVMQSYIIGSAVINAKDIYIANSPKIVVHSYFGTNEGDELIKSFLDYCGISKDNYSVSHELDIRHKADIIEKECNNLKLDYKHNKNIYIVIREFNMPKRNLLPRGSVGDANKVITLLVKKKERVHMLK